MFSNQHWDLFTWAHSQFFIEIIFFLLTILFTLTQAHFLFSLRLLGTNHIFWITTMSLLCTVCSSHIAVDLFLKYWCLEWPSHWLWQCIPSLWMGSMENRKAGRINIAPTSFQITENLTWLGWFCPCLFHSFTLKRIFHFCGRQERLWNRVIARC